MNKFFGNWPVFREFVGLADSSQPEAAFFRVFVFFVICVLLSVLSFNSSTHILPLSYDLQETFTSRGQA